MASIRRGLAPGAVGEEGSAVEANAGNIASSKGNERTIPAPRRKERREMARRVVTNAPERAGELGWLFMGEVEIDGEGLQGVGTARPQEFVLAASGDEPSPPLFSWEQASSASPKSSFLASFVQE